MKYLASYYYLSEIYIQKADYTEAKTYLERLESLQPSNTPMMVRARLNMANCNFALESLKNPVSFEPVNFGPSVNSKNAEYYPTMTVDESEILFTRMIPNPNANAGMHEDFFISNQVNGEWTNSEDLKNVNTMFNEGAPSYSASGNLLFFTACKLWDDYGAGRNGYGSCDIFYAYKEGKTWTQSTNLGGQVNSDFWESQPSFSADGKTLYFIRGKSTVNGITGQDIWYTELQENGEWTKAQKIRGSVNTPHEEESVFIHPDGETLYFASDGHPGMGGLDLFMSKKNTDGSWGTPVNLGYPINTQNDENSLLVSATGELAVFASDRDGGYGDLDLYHFELPNHLLPNAVTYAKGLIVDDGNFRPLGANFELINLDSGESIAIGNSDSRTGEFLIPLPTGKTYMVNVSREGYLFHSENFEISQSNSETHELIIGLKKIKPGNSVVLENVFFDTDSYELKESSKLELGKLASFMKLNSDVKIEIGGHTDNVGSDDDNTSLSQKRADSVVEYLLSQGIEADRISAKGYGETSPIETNDTEAGRAKNRRTEFKIV